MLNELSEEIYQNNKEKGFWDNERNVGEMLMLVTSELGEAMEAHRKGRFANLDMKTIAKQGKYRIIYTDRGTYNVQVMTWFKWISIPFSTSSTLPKKVDNCYGNALIYYRQCLRVKG